MLCIPFCFCVASSFPSCADPGILTADRRIQGGRSAHDLARDAGLSEAMQRVFGIYHVQPSGSGNVQDMYRDRDADRFA